MTDFKNRKVKNSTSTGFISRRNNNGNKRLVRKKIIKKKVSADQTKKRSFLGAFIKNILLFSVLFFFIAIIAGFLYVYFHYYKNLQDITDIEKVHLSESSVILDKNGKELFTVFDKEKRTYVYYKNISDYMKHAVISGEDKTFFENPGVDIKGILRAVYKSVKSGKGPKGTSTISQQLVKNMLLSNERKIDRKIKEALLAYKLNQKYSKETILELYLNKISFGSNASGIEQAAKTFFGISAKDLNILQSSYLASLPKGPTQFSPYRHYDRINGFLYIYNKNKEHTDIGNKDFSGLKLIFDEDIKRNQKAIKKFKDFISNLKAERINDESLKLCGINKDNLKNISNIDTSGCMILNYNELYSGEDNKLGFLDNLIFNLDNDLVLEYQTGRKDFILTRMFTDKYITFEDYKKAIIDSIGFKFKKNKQNIKYPHFVFYVKEYLEKKYGNDVFEKGGLRIYTTLDPEIQDKAQAIVREGVKRNSAKYGAKNAALISIDNKTGHILAYVGGADYYDEKNGGNVDILTSKLQPGSSFKPLVYSLGIDTRTIGNKTPIYDLKTNFGGNYSPQNFDGRFKGKMTISSALNSSRNIPAIKMYFLAGGTDKIVKYLRKLGITTLKTEKEGGVYGPSLGLGTGLIKPLELAQVYSVFANMGKKIEITPILKIENYKNLPIETNDKPKQVLNESTAYIMNYILSNKSGSRPASWNKFMMLSKRTMASKTGTSTDVSKKRGSKIKVHPKNLWTIGYTPAVTTVVWAGNTNGKKLGLRGSGLEGAGPILHKFMDYITIKNPSGNWKRPKSVKVVGISKMSGLLANKKGGITSYFTNMPKKYDRSYKSVKVDGLCNGKITDLTPAEDIKTVYFVGLQSINKNLGIRVPNGNNWNRVVQAWGRRTGKIGSAITNYNSLKECDRNPELMEKSNVVLIGGFANPQNILIVGSNYIQVGYKSALRIKNIKIFLDGKTLLKTIIPTTKSGVFKGNIYIPIKTSGKHSILIKAVDEVSKSYSISKEILVGDTDNIPPKIILTNPKSGIIRIYQNNFFNLRFNVIDETSVKSTNVYLDGNILKAGLIGNNFVVPINSGNNISVGNHIIKIVGIDSKFNKSSKSVALQILEANGPIEKKENSKKEKNIVEKEKKQEKNIIDNKGKQGKKLTEEQKKILEKLTPEQRKKINDTLNK